MRTYLYLKDCIAEFIDNDIELIQGDIVFLEDLPYTVIDIIYSCSIVKKRAELEKQIYLKEGVIKK